MPPELEPARARRGPEQAFTPLRRDPETGLPHIYDHGVTEAEAEEILAHPGEDEPCSRGSRQALGQTADGRYLRVIYVPDEEGMVCLW